VTELIGGLTLGFSAGGEPLGITRGPDGNIWFTQSADPGRVGRVDCDGSVTEFTGGVTPSFNANAKPRGITAGPDGNVWFTQPRTRGEWRGSP
jgi:virginiamycin B lyase